MLFVDKYCQHIKILDDDIGVCLKNPVSVELMLLKQDINAKGLGVCILSAI